MGFSEEMTNLGENIIGSFDTRMAFLGKNIVDVKDHAINTHHLMNDFHKNHKTMGRKLKADLGHFMDDLTGSVGELRKKFRRDQRQLAKTQGANLATFVEDLCENVDEFKDECHKKQRKVKKECNAAHLAWQKVAKTMASRHRAPSGPKRKASKKKK